MPIDGQNECLENGDLSSHESVLSPVLTTLWARQLTHEAKATFGRWRYHPTFGQDKHRNLIIDGLFLGAIPNEKFFGQRCEQAQHICEDCKKRNRPLRHVVSVLEDFGIHPGLFATPTSSTTWEELHVRRTVLNCVDETLNIPFQELLQTVIDIDIALKMPLRDIDDNEVKLGSVYVHCLSGIGRSASVVCAYLCTLYRNLDGVPLSIETAIELLTSQRQQVRPSDTQRKTLKEFLTYYHENLSIADTMMSERKIAHQNYYQKLLPSHSKDTIKRSQTNTLPLDAPDSSEEGKSYTPKISCNG